MARGYQQPGPTKPSSTNASTSLHTEEPLTHVTSTARATSCSAPPHNTLQYQQVGTPEGTTQPHGCLHFAGSHNGATMQHLTYNEAHPTAANRPAHAAAHGATMPARRWPHRQATQRQACVPDTGRRCAHQVSQLHPCITTAMSAMQQAPQIHVARRC